MSLHHQPLERGSGSPAEQLPDALIAVELFEVGERTAGDAGLIGQEQNEHVGTSIDRAQRDTDR
jgi:hypothetical protein